MARPFVLGLGMALILPLVASAEEGDVKARAQAILDKGSALFDKKDAAVMAATYTTDAQFSWFEREGNPSEIILKSKKGRAEIEAFYRDVFKDEKTTRSTSKNVVEFARLVAPDLMIIHGTFEPDTSKSHIGSFRFVQVRVKQGDGWLIKSLQFFGSAQD